MDIYKKYVYIIVIGMCVPVIYLPMVIIAPALLFLGKQNN